MQVLLLATDERPGMLPLTSMVPGPMLPVVNRPVMATTVEILTRAGLKDILVSLCNRGGSIASYFGSGKRWGASIEYVRQREAWGTAGAIKWAAHLLRETFLVLPADAVIDLDIEAALAFHHSHGGMATVILHRVRPGCSTARVHVTDDGRVLALAGPEADNFNLCLTGAYIFTPAVLEHIPPRTVYDCAGQLLPELLAANTPIYGYEMPGYWNPLDTPAAYQEAQHVFLYSAYSAICGEDEPITGGPKERVRYPSIEGRRVAPGIWVGLNHSIHPTAWMAAPIYIGDNSWIGREVELGPGTVIAPNVVIDDEATVRASTILSNTYVGRLVNIESRIVSTTTIIDPASGECTRVVDPFLLTTVGALRNRPRRTQWLLSRAVGFLLLLPLLLLLLVLSPAVALTAGGQIFNRSRRVGGRVSTSTSGEQPELVTFDLLTFQTRRADGTYTAIGRWLEAWGLQRLPEILNVIRGDIALVGIKPLRLEEVEQLGEEWHQQRHDGIAGLTGLWYVQHHTATDLDTVIVADAYYNATRTWRGDLAILLCTPLVWLRRHGRREVQADDYQDRTYALP